MPQKKKQPHNIFDLIFKRLMHASKPAVLSFINGLFNTNHTLDEELVYLSTETVTDELGRIISDIIIAVGNLTYLIEAQIENDGNMAVRIFQYVYADALKRQKADKDGRITITFPRAKVLYWEPTGSTPEKTIFCLKFPSGNTEEYVVESFKYLNYSIAQLEERKMSLLLPFYVLKLREQVKQAETSEERQRLSEELKDIALELEAIIEHSEKEGMLTPDDRRLMQDFIARLTNYLYDKYSEFREVRKMMQDTLLTYAEEAALKERKKWQEKLLTAKEAAIAAEKRANKKWQEKLHKEQVRIQELEAKLKKYEGRSG
ncbi:RpnC/YadD family protein [Breznakiellaceae bacterium SP9]